MTTFLTGPAPPRKMHSQVYSVFIAKRPFQRHGEFGKELQQDLELSQSSWGHKNLTEISYHVASPTAFHMRIQYGLTRVRMLGNVDQFW